MQARQDNLLAVFVDKKSNAINYSGQKETLRTYTIIDKHSERMIVTCSVYTGRSKNSNTVHASLWVFNIKNPSFNSDYTSGTGKASGYGYHKASTAIDEAIASAGIELYGKPCASDSENVDFKTRAYIDGVGDSAIESALLAIAYSAGYNDVIFV